jgi:hypothetical protein
VRYHGCLAPHASLRAYVVKDGRGPPPSKAEVTAMWEDRGMGTEVQPEVPLDAGQMKIAFGTDNNKCHYIWNETTGSDFHTECTYTADREMLTFTAPADPEPGRSRPDSARIRSCRVVSPFCSCNARSEPCHLGDTLAGVGRGTFTLTRRVP